MNTLPQPLASATPEEASEALDAYQQDLAQPEGSEERALAEARWLEECNDCGDDVVEGIIHHCLITGTTVEVSR